MTPIQKIAALLRAPEETIAELFDKMEKLTGKTGVAQKIYEENEATVRQKLQDLGIGYDKADAPRVEAELLKKTKEADAAFYEFLGRPDFSQQASCGAMIDAIEQVANLKPGYFLKEKKLKNFLILNPPKNILAALGYKTAAELLKKEELFEIFAALRFVENERWLNEVFFRPYNDLTAEHFEERAILVRVLSEKWSAIAEEFVGKKLHHISHLKEVGLVFVIPVKKAPHQTFSGGSPGQSLETFSLILHYLHEVDFYCRLFKKYSALPNFGSNLVKLLSGEVGAAILPKDGMYWRIIQRYLAKIDPQDPRLFEPHVNPETVHWLKAEKEMDTLAQKNPQIKMDFWRGVDDFVGEVFPAGKKGEDIVSFDLLDNIISLTHGGLGKYLYHQQEALWNKIFIEFMGEEKLEEMIVENIEKGYIELK
ncbi:MAG: Uncharacterized protein LiPW39_184 [Parcubacteria group bacterium LiPW_39]|nr:MAG: Uncharacterized protein LiPW39_184 [Parcubacteria group bacterium LiPW_39]